MLSYSASYILSKVCFGWTSMAQNHGKYHYKYLCLPNYVLPKWLLGKKVCCSHILLKHRQTHTHTYKDTSRGVSSPTALFLSGEVDLEVV